MENVHSAKKYNLHNATKTRRSHEHSKKKKRQGNSLQTLQIYNLHISEHSVQTCVQFNNTPIILRYLILETRFTLFSKKRQNFTSLHNIHQIRVKLNQAGWLADQHKSQSQRIYHISH